jgi:hypothetical protein
MSQQLDDEMLRDDDLRKGDAWYDGYLAYQNGKSKVDDNPYEDDYNRDGDQWPFYFAWRDGWEKAAWND